MISQMLYILPVFAPAYQGVENNCIEIIDICCFVYFSTQNCLTYIRVCSQHAWRDFV